MPKNTHFTTIRLTDTADHWSRKVHINVRNGKVTQVYRWKSADGRDHTQRTTLNDDQVIKLIGALSRGVHRAAKGDPERQNDILKKLLGESSLAE